LATESGALLALAAAPTAVSRTTVVVELVEELSISTAAAPAPINPAARAASAATAIRVRVRNIKVLSSSSLV
jgi:hypothetical protein